MAEQNATRIIVKGRLSYAHLLEKTSRTEGGEKDSYGTVVLVPKTDTAQIAIIEAAIEAAKLEGKATKAKWKGKIPNNLDIRFQDGDEADLDKNPEYAGHMYFNCYTKTKPGIIDRAKNPLTDPEKVYSGMFAAVVVSVFPFDTMKNGVSFALNNVMKLKDGEKFGSSRSADEDFADFELADDDDDFLG